MKTIIHRPGKGLEGRNAVSLADAYVRTTATGPDGIELDVRVTADGVPIVAHDPMIWTQGRRRLLSSRRFADLPADAFLKLDDLMWLLGGFAGRVYVEIKDVGEAPVNHVLDALEPFRPQVWFISLPWKRDALRHVQRRWDDARTNQIVIHPAASHISHARAANVGAVTFGWSRVNAFRMISPDRVRRFVDAAQNAGLEVSAGLANSAGDLAWAKRMGFEMVWLDPHALDLARATLHPGTKAA